MGVIPADQLARMQDTVERSFPDDVVLRRTGTGSDAEGNATAVLAPVATGAGHLVQATGRDSAVAAQEGEAIEAAVLVPLDFASSATPAGPRPGDLIETRGDRWTVRVVIDARTHLRLLVGRVGT